MSAKLPRLTDLLAALLVRRYPVSFEELRRDVPAYSDPDRGDDALMRMFERDKDELRAFGIPIETAFNDDGEAIGYKLAARDFYLPYLYVAASDAGAATEPRRVDRYGYHTLRKLAFEADELAAVAVADAADRARSLGDPVLREHADSAMRKLAFDLPVDAGRGPDESHVALRGRQPDAATFELLTDALLGRKVVRFEYYAIGSDEQSNREVEPYGLFFIRSHWYLAGHDREREGLRNFRVERMSNIRVNLARQQSPDFDVPPDFALREHARSRQAWELGDDDPLTAVVEFRAHTGATTAAAVLGEPVEGEPPQLVTEYRRVAEETLARYAA